MDKPGMTMRLTTWTDMLVVGYLIITAAIVFIERTALANWPVFLLAHLGAATLVSSLGYSP